MERTAQKRVLLIGADEAFRKTFQQVLCGAECESVTQAKPAAASDRPGAGCGLLANLAVETADDLAAALQRIHAAGNWPYLAAVVHAAALDRACGAASAEPSPTGSRSGLVALLDRLREADEDLPLVVCLPGKRRDELRQVGAEQALWLPLPLDAELARRVLAAQIDRRLVRLRTAHELKSLRLAAERVEQLSAAAERARSEMLANVSHELRTPLNAILGFARLLMKEPLTPGQREKLGYVCQGAAALRDQVDHLLEFARLSTGGVELSQTPFAIEKVIRSVLEKARPKAEAKGLAVYCHLSEGVPRWLRGDRHRLAQLLDNLVDNAIKFTLQGAVHVQVVLDDETADEATLRITVSDTGVGIAPDRQAQIFDSFAQGDGSSTRRFGGLGLGLAICKQLIDLMGGQIGFRSVPDQGSSFWVCLTLPKADMSRARNPTQKTSGAAGTPSPPASHAPADLLSPAAASARAPDAVCQSAVPPAQTAWSGKPRVLVAQPDRLCRSMAEVFLSRAGCLVDQACTTSEALRALRQASYDLVLIDAEMMEPAGPKALEDFRRHEAGCGRKAKVVVLVDDEPSVHDSPWLRHGADQCLAKPCSLESLLELIDQYVLPNGPGTPGPGVAQPSAAQGSDREQHAPVSPEQIPELAVLLEELQEGQWEKLDAEAGRLRRRWLAAGEKRLADAALRVQLAARSNDPRRGARALVRLENAVRQSAAGETRRQAHV